MDVDTYPRSNKPGVLLCPRCLQGEAVWKYFILMNQYKNKGRVDENSGQAHERQKRYILPTRSFIFRTPFINAVLALDIVAGACREAGPETGWGVDSAWSKWWWILDGTIVAAGDIFEGISPWCLFIELCGSFSSENRGWWVSSSA